MEFYYTDSIPDTFSAVIKRNEILNACELLICCTGKGEF